MLTISRQWLIQIMPPRNWAYLELWFVKFATDCLQMAHLNDGPTEMVKDIFGLVLRAAQNYSLSESPK